LGFGAVSVTAERETVVDFSIPYFDYSGVQMVLIATTDTSGSNLFYFLTVFDSWVWLCIGLTLIATSILVTLFDRLSPYSFQNKKVLKEGEPEGKVFTFKEAMWFVLGAYTQAGWTDIKQI
jgi:glutamate receptor, ionotropic, invertebrate